MNEPDRPRDGSPVRNIVRIFGEHENRNIPVYPCARNTRDVARSAAASAIPGARGAPRGCTPQSGNELSRGRFSPRQCVVKSAKLLACCVSPAAKNARDLVLLANTLPQLGVCFAFPLTPGLRARNRLAGYSFQQSTPRRNPRN